VPLPCTRPAADTTARNRHSVRMRLTYDPDADAAFIYIVDSIGPSEVTQTRMVDVAMREAAVIAHFDSATQLLGIEILGASRALRPEVIAIADRP
jgi:uncharacterized protein YuzE